MFFSVVVAPYAPEFKGVFVSIPFQHSCVGPCLIVRDRAVGGEVYVNFSQPLAAILRCKCSG